MNHQCHRSAIPLREKERNRRANSPREKVNLLPRSSRAKQQSSLCSISFLSINLCCLLLTFCLETDDASWASSRHCPLSLRFHFSRAGRFPIQQNQKLSPGRRINCPTLFDFEREVNLKKNPPVSICLFFSPSVLTKS